MRVIRPRPWWQPLIAYGICTVASWIVLIVLGWWFALLTVLALVILLAAWYPDEASAVQGIFLGLGMTWLTIVALAAIEPGGYFPPGEVATIAFVLATLASMPLAALGILSAAMFKRFARIAPPAGECATCGYDLRGSASGQCPECGTMCASETTAHG